MSSYKDLAMKIAGAALVGIAVALVAALASWALYGPDAIDRPAYPLLAGETVEQPETVEATPPETVEATPPETVEATPPETVEATPPETVEATPPETVEATPPETQPENTTETETAAAETTQPETPASGLGALLASADAEAGKKLAKKCSACHTINKGGKNKIGPTLWDVVGRGIGATEGFKFSGALANLGGTWGYEELDGFLKKPKAFASGTKMSFSGIKSETDRANLIAYLRSLSDDPKALP